MRRRAKAARSDRRPLPVDCPDPISNGPAITANVALRLITSSGPITTTELTEIIGLTAPTIANITKRLLADNLIVEAGRLHGARGQPAMCGADQSATVAYSIGLNIDRDHVTLVALDFVGRVRARATREVPFALPDAIVSFVRTRSGKIVKTGAVDPSRLAGIGVAPFGPGGANLPHRPEAYGVWDDTDIAALLSDVLPHPVHIENDAAAAAIGELRFGQGLRTRSFVYLLISAGLGGGWSSTAPISAARTAAAVKSASCRSAIRRPRCRRTPGPCRMSFRSRPSMTILASAASPSPRRPT